MLYVFHVDSGKMKTFDMSLALESVSNLKRHVQEVFKIAIDKQVLLISGGECLDPNKRVCSYSAGTDTNPIYLFSKSIIEAPSPPLPTADYGSESDLEIKVREHCDMPVTLSTVNKRTQLAQHFTELAREHTATCENLVHDQHLQQQGWSAVVANLEDISLDFKKRSEIFEKSFNDYMVERDSYLTFLTHFNRDLEILQRIPVLSALIELEKQNLDPEISKTSEETTSTSQDNESVKDITLFDWISAADNKSTMDQLYEHCSRGLEQFDTEIFKSLQDEIQEILRSADNPQMKEVKGLGERLSGLETLMREAKKLVRQQAELTQSFLNNQSRASNTKDPSVLPDLCMSHKKQLQMMAVNHQQLCDIRRRCLKAKEELSVNLYHRLRWVMYIEDHILEIDQKLVIYHENLKRLRRHLEVLQQIHLAPATYLCAVAEVVRRRAFSQSFLLWASELACHLLTIHNEEVTRRKEFQSQFESHFLNSLFPGMEDLPPSFATQAPSMFDTSLPKVTEEDIERLKRELPDLADNLNIPDTSAITNFFLMKSLVKKEDDCRAGEEENVMQTIAEIEMAGDNLSKDVTCPATAHGLPHLKDLDRGCESETDTEEFEKVGQSPLELHCDNKIVPSAPRPGTQDAATSTEVGEQRSPLPPKKPPRAFQKSHLQQQSSCSSNTDDHCFQSLQRTPSVSSNTESFANVKNPSLDSIDESSSSCCLKNAPSNTESCFDSHHHQRMQSVTTTLLRPKSVSPCSPQSPKEAVYVHSPNSPFLGHQPGNDFINDEFYIDESLPSSLSIETGQIHGEYDKHLDTANNVVALLQDNLQISRSEHDKLKSLLLKLHQLARDATIQLRVEISELRTHVLSNKNELSRRYESLGSSWEDLIVERDNEEKKLLEDIKNNHQLEIDNIRKQELGMSKQIECLILDKSRLEMELRKHSETIVELTRNIAEIGDANLKKIDQLERHLLEKESEKEKSIKEVTDRLNRDHKTEIENIRSRFKLMTMERSPSDTSLEKSGEFSSLPGHSTLLLQITENFQLDKEKAVNEALLKEREKWENLMAIRIKEMESKFELEKGDLLQDLARKISEEKDKQIEVLREREKNLNLECMKYKTTIQQLAESGFESGDSELLMKINTLQKEKEALEEELSKLKCDKPADMTTSVAVWTEKVDVTTSPIKQKEIMSRSEMSTMKPGKVSVDTCKTGDQVLVTWDVVHESYKILQENRHMFFLHSDYLDALGLEVLDGKPNKFYCIGEVIDKEYCFARKIQGSKGTKFFRVKVRPLYSSGSKEITHSLYHQKSTTSDPTRMSLSQSTIAAVTESTDEDRSGPQSLPSSPTTKAYPVISELDELDAAVAVDGAASENDEKNFAEDSGVVLNILEDIIEQATAAAEETLAERRNESDFSDRTLDCTTPLEEQRTYISSTWLETMISRVFTKSFSE